MRSEDADQLPPAAPEYLLLALTVSVAVHVVVGLLFLIPLRDRARAPALPISIVLQEGELQVPASVPARFESSKRHSRPPKERMRSLRLSDLRPKLNLLPKRDVSSDSDPTAEELPSWTEARAYDELPLTAVGAGESMKQAAFVSSLWQVIDQAIDENPFLSEYNHTGRVFLRFEVDKQGHLETRTFQASAMDRVLKVIAARAVRKAMKNENGDFHFPRQRMVVNAKFTWAGYQDCQGKRGVRGNFLSFCHYAENKRKSFSTGEKVSAYTSAIMNYGPWAIEEFRKYNREQNRRRTQFDPFEEMRLDPDWNL